MSTFKNLYLFAVALVSVSVIFVIYKQTEDGITENPRNSVTIEAEMDPWADAIENRCEGKIHKKPVPLNLQLRQYTRKKMLSKLCNDYANFSTSSKWSTFDDIPNVYLHHLIVEDRHGIIYCNVPKVGCTVWKQIMGFLGESYKVNGVPYRNYLDIPKGSVHVSGLTHLRTYPKEVIKQKIETYKKFLFVRDPFVRLISAYRDKMLQDNQPYYSSVGVSILKTYGNVSNPPASVVEAHAQGIFPPFYGFIRYILSLPAENHLSFDEHWQPIVDLCHPCLINYDFIGKMETIDEDAVHLLRNLKVDNIVNWTPSGNKTEPDDIKTWFSNIPIEWRRKLYELYEADFKLFAYENHETLNGTDPENII